LQLLCACVYENFFLKLYIVFDIGIVACGRETPSFTSHYRLRAEDTFSGICKANSMEQIRNANFSASPAVTAQRIRRIL
jgi:hypothetical protein